MPNAKASDLAIWHLAFGIFEISMLIAHLSDSHMRDAADVGALERQLDRVTAGGGAPLLGPCGRPVPLRPPPSPPAVVVPTRRGPRAPHAAPAPPGEHAPHASRAPHPTPAP